ncbi:recombinase family protein [Alkalibacillus silvisoli]|uniref:Recombinase domain-containing protein n=1 Tax=Alkalibacillus silvisoli TaxID=392823 RepID=A0ABP3JP42_9BACI
MNKGIKLHYSGDLVQHRESSLSVTSEHRNFLPPEEHIVIKDAHPPIITREVFEAAQHMMNIRKRSNINQTKHLFTNFMSCADCGKGMWYRQNRKGNND